MSNDTIRTILQLLAGFFSGLITSWFASRLQKKRPDVEYYYSSMPLLKFKPTSEPVLRVSVDSSVLTGDEADKGKPQEIDDAFGFSILLQNIGNETAESIVLNIELDEEAKILDFRTRPEEAADYPIIIERDEVRLNRIRLRVPHIKVRQKIDVALISTGNRDTTYCKVSTNSKQVNLYPASLWRSNWPVWVGLALLLGITALVQNFVERLPENLLRSLGATLEVKTTIDWVWPFWLRVTGFLVFFSLLFLLARSILRNFDRELHKPWSSGKS